MPVQQYYRTYPGMANELEHALATTLDRILPHVPADYHAISELQRLLARALVDDEVCAMVLLKCRAGTIQSIHPSGEETADDANAPQ